ncbi:hypothetical protein BDQ17DRAFT_339163 [Cyathus striatus]|nr:hypothetical protein BDQ17DRAFT_339163 [Cyathus striatus]
MPTYLQRSDTSSIAPSGVRHNYCSMHVKVNVFVAEYCDAIGRTGIRRGRYFLRVMCLGTHCSRNVYFHSHRTTIEPSRERQTRIRKPFNIQQLEQDVSCPSSEVAHCLNTLTILTRPHALMTQVMYHASSTFTFQSVKPLYTSCAFRVVWRCISEQLLHVQVMPSGIYRSLAISSKLSITHMNTVG